MYTIGYDIGSSSVKASLVDTQTGQCIATDFFPKTEMEIIAHKAGWAEQHPEAWWKNLKLATHSILSTAKIDPKEIKGIGISYQMHGLVVIDKAGNVLRPAIIWCDSRGVPYGNNAFNKLGSDYCLSHLLNSPGNFTASKLAWIKENEPHIYEKIDKILLPGDYIAKRLTNLATTTCSGLSEGIFWDFKDKCISKPLLNAFGFSESILAPLVPTFGMQGEVTAAAAADLNLTEGIPVTYRAGDQPNNALSLNVLNPGEIASTAGTSGVVYGISDQVAYDAQSRVNSFAHVNYTPTENRLGVLLCINGTAILNAWIRRNIATPEMSYADMNELAAQAPVGSKGISILPFGNGAERMLANKEIAASMHGINYNIHDRSHLMRAAQEGIAFSFRYGIDILKQVGIQTHVIKAGHANMYLSPLFRTAVATINNSMIELYDTDGSIGAARGAGIGCGMYKTPTEAFETLKRIDVAEPDVKNQQAYTDAYETWKQHLQTALNNETITL
ncbi:MAG: xylulokinase [Tannerellaceae bacterium]